MYKYLLPHYFDTFIRCLADLWFDGVKCVNRTQCPCMVGHITYEVGSVFEKEDCSECICKLGGVSHCTPKQCGPCKEGKLFFALFLQD